MSESKNYFVFELLVLLWCISFQNVSGIQIKLTRCQNGDYFDNPYATSPDASSFCDKTNAKCQGHKCRYCKCDKVKPFNETSKRCAPIQGCRTWLSENSVKLLDLTRNGMEKLQTDSDKDVKSLHIMSTKFNFFKQKRIHKKQDDSRKKRDGHDNDDDRWEVTIEWKNVPEKKYDGQVFRVQISYEIDDDDSNRTDCFVFKSKGTIPVTFPDLTTTPSLLSTSEKSPTDSFGSTNEARKEESSGGGSNAVAVSLAVVGCLLLLGVILAVLWFRRRSARTSQDKSREISFKNGNVENSMKISQPENVHVEAESSITSVEKDEDNLEYDYADGNLKNYASLDMTKVESKPVYQSLINVERDVNKRIPSESGETSTAEPFYHVVEGEDGNQHPGQVYHVLEDPEKSDNCETKDAPGRTEHENPVYSTLEEDAPETYDREVSEGTGDDNPERVYSVLEN